MVEDDRAPLLVALREELGLKTVKDGCSPQGQCGCCTVLVDGSPRVSCVTAVRRVAGRAVTTAEGLPPSSLEPLVDAFLSRGASQCGFCTPGILCRLASLGPRPAEEKVNEALLAHLCRCTGWRSIVDAAVMGPHPPAVSPAGVTSHPERDLEAASRRAALEGGVTQRVGAEVVMGRGGFADDCAPADALVAVSDGRGGWAVAETLAEARAASGKLQGRRSGQGLRWPIQVPPGEWDLSLQTTWVEPAYLEPDASWCRPGGSPASPVANGGAFGAKLSSPAPGVARQLADRYGRAVRVLLSREDTVRIGGKRPPVAAGVRLDGTGVMRIARSEATALARSVAAGMEVEEVDLVGGMPVSGAIRAAGWAEAAVIQAAARALRTGTVKVGERWQPPASAPATAPAPAGIEAVVTSPSGARASATVETDRDGRPVRVWVELTCGDPLDEVVLRSYATGAVHMALGWVCSEGIALGPDGAPADLTIRSFGILRARDTPSVVVDIAPDRGAPVPGSDAVFAATAAAIWIAQGLPPRWPTMRSGAGQL